MLTQETKNLIEKLKMAKEIYQKASDRAQSQLMIKLYLRLAKKKSNFLIRLNEKLISGNNELPVKPNEELQVQLKKIGLEINNILSKFNDEEVLDFCIRREYELISMYHNVLNNISGDKFFRDIIVSQLLATSETKEMLEEKAFSN